MNVTQHDEVMETARVMAYAVARLGGRPHWEAKVLAKENAKLYIDEAYEWLDYKPKNPPTHPHDGL